jgi:uncharacterized protein HemX
MVVLGLLLMLACVAVAIDAVVQNAAAIHVVGFDHTISGLSIGALFVAGAVVGLVFALGMALFTGGLGRAARIRRERRALRRESADTESLREQNALLEQQLAANRSEAGAYPDEPAATQATTTGRHRVSK